MYQYNVNDVVKLTMKFLLQVVNMVTDVSDELSTPVLTVASLFARSPSLVNEVISPPPLWSLDFTSELDDDMRALISEMEAGDSTNSAQAPTSAAVVTGDIHQPSTSAARQGEPLSSPTPSDATSFDSPTKKKAKSKARSLKVRKQQGEPGPWSTDPEDHERLRYIGLNTPRAHKWMLDANGQQIALPLEYHIPAPTLALKQHSARGYIPYVPINEKLNRNLTKEEIELLFFNRATFGMPTRVLMLLTIATREQWEKLVGHYRTGPLFKINPKDSTQITGICRQVYNERNVIDPAYLGPNLERNGRTIAIACGDVTERFSQHCFCGGCTVEKGQHWCSMDGLCQVCKESGEMVVRERYKRLNDAFEDVKAERHIAGRRIGGRGLVNQHMINVEQVDILKKLKPDWQKPSGLEVPNYNLDDFKPTPLGYQRVAVASAPLFGEYHEPGHRLMKQPNGNESQVWSRRQMEDMAFKFCHEKEFTLTSGQEEDKKVHEWLKGRYGESRRKVRPSPSPAGTKRKVPRLRIESSTDDEAAGDVGRREPKDIHRKPKKRPREAKVSATDDNPTPTTANPVVNEAAESQSADVKTLRELGSEPPEREPEGNPDEFSPGHPVETVRSLVYTMGAIEIADELLREPIKDGNLAPVGTPTDPSRPTTTMEARIMDHDVIAARAMSTIDRERVVTVQQTDQEQSNAEGRSHRDEDEGGNESMDYEGEDYDGDEEDVTDGNDETKEETGDAGEEGDGDEQEDDESEDDGDEKDDDGDEESQQKDDDEEDELDDEDEEDAENETDVSTVARVSEKASAETVQVESGSSVPATTTQAVPEPSQQDTNQTVVYIGSPGVEARVRAHLLKTKGETESRRLLKRTVDDGSLTSGLVLKRSRDTKSVEPHIDVRLMLVEEPSTHGANVASVEQGTAQVTSVGEDGSHVSSVSQVTALVDSVDEEMTEQNQGQQTSSQPTVVTDRNPSDDQPKPSTSQENASNLDEAAILRAQIRKARAGTQTKVPSQQRQSSSSQNVERQPRKTVQAKFIHSSTSSVERVHLLALPPSIDRVKMKQLTLLQSWARRTPKEERRQPDTVQLENVSQGASGEPAVIPDDRTDDSNVQGTVTDTESTQVNQERTPENVDDLEVRPSATTEPVMEGNLSHRPDDSNVQGAAADTEQTQVNQESIPDSVTNLEAGPSAPTVSVEEENLSQDDETVAECETWLVPYPPSDSSVRTTQQELSEVEEMDDATQMSGHVDEPATNIHDVIDPPVEPRSDRNENEVDSGVSTVNQVENTEGDENVSHVTENETVDESAYTAPQPVTSVSFSEVTEVTEEPEVATESEKVVQDLSVTQDITSNDVTTPEVAAESEETVQELPGDHVVTSNDVTSPSTSQAAVTDAENEEHAAASAEQSTIVTPTPDVRGDEVSVPDVANEVEVDDDTVRRPEASTTENSEVKITRSDGSHVGLSPEELQELMGQPPVNEVARQEHLSNPERMVATHHRENQLTSVDSFVDWVIPRPVERVKEDVVQTEPRVEAIPEENQVQEVGEEEPHPAVSEAGSSHTRRRESGDDDMESVSEPPERHIDQGEVTTSEVSSEENFYDALSEQVTGEATPSEVSGRVTGEATPSEVSENDDDQDPGTSAEATAVIHQPTVYHISAEALALALAMAPPGAPIRALAEEDEKKEICPSSCRPQ